MTRRRTVTATGRTTAPVAEVWSLLARATSWRDWTPFTVAELEREGAPPPDGVGAVRRFGFRLFTSREEVVAFDEPTHLGYTLLSGLPVRDYRSDVTLTAMPDGGTTVEWRSSFDPPWAGTGRFWQIVIGLVVADFTRRLTKAATRGTAS